MKYTIFLLVIFILNNQHAVAQDTSSDKKNYYLNKSKAQKTTGWVFIGAGAAAIITGTIIATSVNEEGDWNDELSTAVTGGGFILAGGVSCLVSIPFFVSSSKNKRKAMALASGLQQVPMPANGLTIQQPAITVSWTIGR